MSKKNKPEDANPAVDTQKDQQNLNADELPSAEIPSTVEEILSNQDESTNHSEPIATEIEANHTDDDPFEGLDLDKPIELNETEEIKADPLAPNDTSSRASDPLEAIEPVTDIPKTEYKIPKPAAQATKNPKKDKTPPASPIIIKKIKKHGHAHHGGAWKIAFADFVTAMMAFFLLMWLLAALNKAQKEGVADYFKQPIKVSLFGGRNTGDQQENLRGGGSDITQKDGLAANKDKTPSESQKTNNTALKEAEMKQLQKIKLQLAETIEKDPAFMGLKQQLMMDITKDGLRIQLIDDQNRPMFEMGKDQMNAEMQQLMKKIVLLIKDSPNKITIQGHTDANPYDNPEELQTSNWELSTQRANAARRALIQAGLDENKIMRVTGFASTLLLDKKNPLNPKNRRISIIIMKKEAEDNVLLDN